VDAAQSNIERRSQEFMKENEFLLDEGSLLALQRVVVQGAEIERELSKEVVDAADAAAYATRELTAAIRDPLTSPRRIQELETQRTRAMKIHETKSAAFREFDGFMQRASEARRQVSSE
jgi:hypothetical protein